jgi:hypothetical protein
MKNRVASLVTVLSLAFIVGCGSNKQDRVVPSSAEADPVANIDAPPAATSETAPAATTKPPFEYKVIENTESVGDFGPQVVMLLETTNDVAKKATEEDLRKLWDYLAPTIGDRRAGIRIRTSVPGVFPWGIISRYRDINDGKWVFKVVRNEFGIDAEPYFFVNKIDRSVLNQRGMVLTLPVVNRVVEHVKRHGWDVKIRKEDFVSAEVSAGAKSATLTMTPEHLSFDGYRLDDLTFVDTAVSILDELGIGEQVKAKLQSVIGSPEYLRADSGEQARWTWTIREYEVDYCHYDKIDELYVSYYK